MQENIEIKFVKMDINATLPTKAHDDDNCWDMYAVERIVIPAQGNATVNVGLKLGYITPGFGIVFKPRSGLGFKNNLQPHLGEIDCVPTDTKIATTNGDITVSDLIKLDQLPSIISYNIEKNSLEEDKIDEIYLVPNKKMIKIETSGGNVRIPETKQVYTKRGWIQAKELTLDDEVLTLHT